MQFGKLASRLLKVITLIHCDTLSVVCAQVNVYEKKWLFLNQLCDLVVLRGHLG